MYQQASASAVYRVHAEGVNLAQRGWLWQPRQWHHTALQRFAVSRSVRCAEAHVHRCGASAPCLQRLL